MLEKIGFSEEDHGVALTDMCRDRRGEIFTGTCLYLHFEECIRQGIDAIEYAYSVIHRDEDIKDEMDMKMLGL